jgi:hypothetical protein
VTFTARPIVTLESLEHSFRSKSDHGLILKFSDPVDPQRVADAIKISPPVGRLQVRPVDPKTPEAVKIIGAFTSGTTYRVIVKPQMVTAEGAYLEADRRDFEAAGPPPAIHLTTDRHVIERNSRQVLPVQVKNLKGVRCRITAIPPLFAPKFSAFSFPNPQVTRDSDSDEDEELDEAGKEKLAGEVREAQQYLITSLKRLERLQALASASAAPLPFTPFLGRFTIDSEAFFNQLEPYGRHQVSVPLTFRADPRQGGVHLVELGDPEPSPVPGRHQVVQITDLALTYKRSGTNLLLWVTSLEAAKPVQGAHLMVSDTDGRRFFLGTTDAQGLILARHGQRYPTLAFDGDTPVLGSGTLALPSLRRAVAALADDACAISLQELSFTPFAIPRAKPGTTVELPRNGHVFTERGVYKQGETVFWKVAVRSFTDGGITAPAKECVEVRVRNPRREEIARHSHRLNEFGTCSGSIVISGFAPLGNYSISVHRCASDSVAVEDEETVDEAGVGENEEMEDGQVGTSPTSGQETTDTGMETGVTTARKADSPAGEGQSAKNGEGDPRTPPSDGEETKGTGPTTDPSPTNDEAEPDAQAAVEEGSAGNDARQNRETAEDKEKDEEQTRLAQTGFQIPVDLLGAHAQSRHLPLGHQPSESCQRDHPAAGLLDAAMRVLEQGAQGWTDLLPMVCAHVQDSRNGSRSFSFLEPFEKGRQSEFDRDASRKIPHLPQAAFAVGRFHRHGILDGVGEGPQRSGHHQLRFPLAPVRPEPERDPRRREGGQCHGPSCQLGCQQRSFDDPQGGCALLVGLVGSGHGADQFVTLHQEARQGRLQEELLRDHHVPLRGTEGMSAVEPDGEDPVACRVVGQREVDGDLPVLVGP